LFNLLTPSTTMKFICTQENLIIGINTVVHIAGKNTTLPILNNIKIKTTANGLELISTNLEIAVTTFVRGRVEEEGELTIPARLLAETVSLLPKENITILQQGSNDIILLSEKNKTVLRGAPSDDFPVIPQINQGIEVYLPSQPIVDALSRVVLAVNPLESRPEISGVYVVLEKNKLVLVGTDSYRLAEEFLEIKNQDKEISFLLPLKTCQEIIRLFGGQEEDLKLLIGDSQVSCGLGGINIISRLINGQYPDYKQIIPTQTNTTTVVDKNNLIQAVKSASLFVRSGINDIKVKIDVGGNEVEVSSLNSQLGENVTKIATNKSQGDSLETVFNYRYLLDVLQSVVGQEVVIGATSANSPVVIRSAKQEGYLYLLMPIRQ
ncbi:MAG: DNA polymerase III subunit beta, partial [Patescibacteria group bacterium]